MNNQEPSKSTANEIKDGPTQKKLKKGSKSDGKNQVQVENQCLIDKLPPEMLMSVFNCLDTVDLFNCRLVSRKWNGIATKILKSRDDFEVKFKCHWGQKDKKLKIINTIPQKALSTFLKRFKPSKKAPLPTRFLFNGFETAVFDHVDWIKFISDYGESITCLKLVLEDRLWTADEVKKLVKKLRHLLLNQLPNLQEFGLKFPYRSSNNPFLPGFELFPKTTTTSQVQLPHLKVVYLEESYFSQYTGIVTDILIAAVNLQKLESCGYFNFDDGNVKTFQLLHSLGKLQCLQTAKICLDAEFLSGLKEMSPLHPGFKLKKLNLTVSADVYRNTDSWSAASLFLSHIFESIKDTLTKLKMTPLGFLLQLQLTKLRKLTNLKILKWSQENVQVLPPGTNLNEIAPSLQHLELQVPWTAVFPNDQNETVCCLPTLETVVITHAKITKDDIASISKVCPNLKNFRTFYHRGGAATIENFREVGNAIWTLLRNLESLHLETRMDPQVKAFRSIDSCFTGFSQRDCARLNKELFYAGESDQKQQVYLSESDSDFESELDLELKREALRKSPSILELKDLKILTIRLVGDFEEDVETSDCEKYKKTLSVSEKYALKLMDGLSYNIWKYGGHF